MEIHPSYRLDRHFRLAARQAGKVRIILCVESVAIELEDGLHLASQASDNCVTLGPMSSCGTAQIYMPLRLTTPISCQGTSDNLQVTLIRQCTC
jgi:hypothetical protein